MNLVDLSKAGGRDLLFYTACFSNQMADGVIVFVEAGLLVFKASICFLCNGNFSCLGEKGEGGAK